MCKLINHLKGKREPTTNKEDKIVVATMRTGPMGEESIVKHIPKKYLKMNQCFSLFRIFPWKQILSEKE